MNNSKLWAFVAINAVVIICWTTIAIYFNNWWLMLLSCLFTFHEKDKE